MVSSAKQKAHFVESGQSQKLTLPVLSCTFKNYCMISHKDHHILISLIKSS
jgi:hypothetical protein